ncbi:MAG: response regulator [Myxococcales bacterium]|nr:response regulator [Myxococcales bacterium]
MLIVDDNRDLADNLGEVLEDEGYDCAIAYDAISAIDRIRARHFDLVVTDLRMSPLDGLTVVHAARLRSQETIVVLMTAFAGDVQLEAAMAAGVAEVVAKPIDTLRFVEFVRDRVAQA